MSDNSLLQRIGQRAYRLLHVVELAWSWSLHSRRYRIISALLCDDHASKLGSRALWRRSKIGIDPKAETYR
jgi:hypothetical protein